MNYEQSIKKLYTEFERLQSIIDELKRERKMLLEKVNIALCRIWGSVTRSRD